MGHVNAKDHLWKIVPLSRGQRLDVRPEDVLEGGVYRTCDAYRGGGGYDKFPHMAAAHFGGSSDYYSQQFVVQLYGCNLDCFYCYVTREGVWGKFVRRTSIEVVEAFVAAKAPVFHLMGGAPALQMRHWCGLIEEIQLAAPQAVFHSDMMLTETAYDSKILARLSRSDRCLFAIDVKGLNPHQWLKNTRKPLNESLFWRNWLIVQAAGISAYVTFTDVDSEDLAEFWERASQQGVDSDMWSKNAFVIDLIDYEAGAHVDDVPWGARK